MTIVIVIGAVIAWFGLLELLRALGELQVYSLLNQKQGASHKPDNVDPSTFVCALCKHPYDIVGETSLHIIWRCVCGKSEYRQRKRRQR
jgi:hypothetical protein